MVGKGLADLLATVRPCISASGPRRGPGGDPGQAQALHRERGRDRLPIGSWKGTPIAALYPRLGRHPAAEGPLHWSVVGRLVAVLVGRRVPATTMRVLSIGSTPAPTSVRRVRAGDALHIIGVDAKGVGGMRGHPA